MEEEQPKEDLKDIFESSSTSACCFVSCILLVTIGLLTSLNSSYMNTLGNVQVSISMGLAAIAIAIIFVGLQIYRIGTHEESKTQ